MRNKLIKEATEAGMYSIMAETTPDVSHKDRHALACKYANDSGQARECLISFGETQDKQWEWVDMGSKIKTSSPHCI